MERKLDEIRDRLVRLETAEEYRHQALAYHIQALIHRHEQGQQSSSSGWLLKVPLALALPVAVFLLMLAITHDPRAAFNFATKAG